MISIISPCLLSCWWWKGKATLHFWCQGHRRHYRLSRRAYIRCWCWRCPLTMRPTSLVLTHRRANTAHSTSSVSACSFILIHHSHDISFHVSLRKIQTPQIWYTYDLNRSEESENTPWFEINILFVENVHFSNGHKTIENVKVVVNKWFCGKYDILFLLLTRLGTFFRVGYDVPPLG